LALNVSAEIINAFFKFRDGLERTNMVVKDANTAKIESMEVAVKKKPDYKPLVPAAKEIQSVIADFTGYINDVTGRFDEAAGGIIDDPEDENFGKPERFKDKEIPTRFFVDGYEGPVGESVTAEGPMIKQKVAETQQKLIEVLDKLKGNKTLAIKADEIEDLKSKLI